MKLMINLIIVCLSWNAWSSGFQKTQIELGPYERLVSVLSTNDIHGSIYPRKMKQSGKLAGGMALWASAVSAIRSGLNETYGKKAGLILLDGGDQFQGTLVSNYNEGKLIFQAMSAVGYDAAVPGNHDYDFGPRGWLDDRVIQNNPDKDPRGALEDALKKAEFPLLAANVYLRKSLVNAKGKKMNPDDSNERTKIQWKKAKRLSMKGAFRPYMIKKVGGVKVAVIGMDNPRTPHMTTQSNVSDLYFRDEKDEYLEIRESLEGKADVFILVMHNGNARGDKGASELIKTIIGKNNRFSGSKRKIIDLVIAGHTHNVNREMIGDVPMVQAGWGVDRFNRVDLVVNTKTHEVKVDSNYVKAGIHHYYDQCESQIQSQFCEVRGGKVYFEGVAIQDDSVVDRLIEKAKEAVAPIANRVLGIAEGEIWKHRTFENPMSNYITDSMREVTGADIAFVNTGGVRAGIDPGPITYEKFYQVFPFSNKLVTAGPMKVSKIIALLNKSVQSCGSYSVLMPSGIKVLFEQDCKNRAVDGMDAHAQLLKVELVDHPEVIFDRREGGILGDPNRTFLVSTFDFLVFGGSGYSDFVGTPIVKDYGILREVFTDRFLRNPVRWSNKRDQRWMAIRPSKKK